MNLTRAATIILAIADELRRDNDIADMIERQRAALQEIRDASRYCREHNVQTCLMRCGCTWDNVFGLRNECERHKPKMMGSLPDCVERDMGTNLPGIHWTGD